MKRSPFCFIPVFFICSAVFSQNNSTEPAVKKELYRVINTGSDNPAMLYKALNHCHLDSLRFLNERRQLAVEGTTLVLELFSANELLERYGKPVSLLTIKDPAKARKVKLKINSHNMIEAVGI